jgi:hypothetical protein
VERQAIPYEILHDTSGKAAALFGAAPLPASYLSSTMATESFSGSATVP